MKAEIITIGDEILIGQTIDTNSAWIANELNLMGIHISKITSISDTKQEIFKALDNAKASSDLILITGGLGPTNDDITKKSLAEYFNVKLVEDKKTLENIEKLLSKYKNPMNERNIKQSEVPENCTVILNKIGTAPGMLFKIDNKIIISMPGVPFEMKEMMTNSIIPYLMQQKKSNNIILHKNILVYGISESKLAETIEDWELKLPKTISLAYLPSPGIIKLRFTAIGNNKLKLENTIKEEVNKLKKIIPDYLLGLYANSIEKLIGELLKKHKKTLSVAESCTGGNIAKMITSISGCSEYFYGGVVAYANNIKKNILGVSKSNLDNYGAVSKQVVEEMAMGALKLYNTDYSIATSGIAGPTGGTEVKPVGTVWIAVAHKSDVYSQKFLFGSNREINIKKASVTAINMLLKKYLLT